jgi:hypothetical protein
MELGGLKVNLVEQEHLMVRIDTAQVGQCVLFGLVMKDSFRLQERRMNRLVYKP